MKDIRRNGRLGDEPRLFHRHKLIYRAWQWLRGVARREVPVRFRLA
jgi:hypothetical protein